MLRTAVSIRPSATALAASIALSCAMAACAGRSSADQEANVQKLIVQSSAFEQQGSIPARYTCDGEDVSPPLSWNDGPAGTATYALIMDDPDAPGGTFVHWVMWNLTETALAEGLKKVPTLPGGERQGRNSYGKSGYGGPCPPSGTHRYVFKVLALDRKLDLPDSTDDEDLLLAMREHVLARGELVGRYARR